jgi:hypothetical protein
VITQHRVGYIGKTLEIRGLPGGCSHLDKMPGEGHEGTDPQFIIIALERLTCIGISNENLGRHHD